MQLSMQRVLDLRAEAFADDLEVSEAMTEWSESEVEEYFATTRLPKGRTLVADKVPCLPTKSSKALRFLSLHGSGANKTVNQYQLARFRKTLQEQRPAASGSAPVQFDYVEGAIKPNIVDETIKSMFGDKRHYTINYYLAEDMVEVLGKSCSPRHPPPVDR